MGGGAGEAPCLARSISVDTLPETPRSAESLATRKDDCDSPASPRTPKTPSGITTTTTTTTTTTLVDLRSSSSVLRRRLRLGGIRENVVAPLVAAKMRDETLHEKDGRDEDDEDDDDDEDSDIDGDLVDNADDDDEEEEEDDRDDDDHKEDCYSTSRRERAGSAHASFPASPEAGESMSGIPGCIGPAPPLSPSDSDQKRPCVLSVEDEIGIEALLDFSSALPSRLPEVSAVERDRKAYAGPTDESNWVIPGRLMVGAYPAEADDQSHDALLNAILECGVTTFVCLQAEYNHYAPATAPIRPYIRDAFRLCQMREREARQKSPNEVCAASKLGFLHLPIVDCKVTGDEVVRALAEALCWRLVSGEVIYLHCWGGHGRTGTLVAVMLGMLYKISKSEALKRTQLYHDCRSCPLQVQSPQTFSQRMQVLRILDSVRGRPSILEQHLANPYASRDMGQIFQLPVAPTSAAALRAKRPLEIEPLPVSLMRDTDVSSPLVANGMDRAGRTTMDMCKRRKLGPLSRPRSLRPPPMSSGHFQPANVVAGSTPPRSGASDPAAVPSNAAVGTPGTARKRNLHLVR
ncbi:Hypothetical Protein FCC1311_089472 [Hondaea fermentalgiana]|uniref:Tyrosine specific protein phosphatases domain-containing protein n=1 Tax=Hondaea fermentalgiana TaxID=2315210 RepID=A0A2R5GPB8_9STRA|nr:Hypothetical Protein FCC1311_089472 [Hondaea fermentalgiana]|eukprot:GBG32722.1 Hypothetical Protein FCC1311_089472 [Hondaea fermentalgiana]